jgi:hypothetical protein
LSVKTTESSVKPSKACRDPQALQRSRVHPLAAFLAPFDSLRSLREGLNAKFMPFPDFIKVLDKFRYEVVRTAVVDPD